jgi:type II secretory ATPase GspE/PulE/Tfp pilus assembly ATPase PilB-like protein
VLFRSRLVRRICPQCKAPAPADRQLISRLGPRFAHIETVHRGQGCPHCHGTGYKGRLGVYEVLTLDDELRDRIGGGASILEIQRALRQRGVHGIAHDAALRVLDGTTTLEEIMRVIGPQDGKE